jgi:hypothetical protein
MKIGRGADSAFVLIVDEPVAVVVDFVALLDCGGIHQWVAVVAVTGVEAVSGGGVAVLQGVVVHAVAVGVGVFVPSHRVEQRAVFLAFVHYPIAVFVEWATGFFGTRVDSRNGVVAVTLFGIVVFGLGAGENRVVFGAVAIEIGVAVLQRSIEGVVFIRVAIAVVVDAVADLIGSGVGGGLVVIAIAVFNRDAVIVFILSNALTVLFDGALVAVRLVATTHSQGNQSQRHQ